MSKSDWVYRGETLIAENTRLNSEVARLKAELKAAMDIAIVLNAEIEDDSSDILARLHHLLIMPESERKRITKIIRRAIHEMIEPGPPNRGEHEET